jgi:hypothetical protein
MKHLKTYETYENFKSNENSSNTRHIKKYWLLPFSPQDENDFLDGLKKLVVKKILYIIIIMFIK